MVLNLSDIISTQLPEFVREEYPRFLSFIKYYYREQERTGNSLDLINNYVKYFDINYQNYGSSVNSILENDIDNEQTEIRCSGIDLFPLEDGYIKINDEIIFYDIRDGQTLKNCKRGRTYKDSLVVGSYKNTIPTNHFKGSIVYDISNLFLEVILKRFQEQLLNNFPYEHIIDSVDKRQIIKYIKDFYVSKGTKDSLKFIFSILLESKDDELDRYAPKDFVYKLSDSDYEDSYGIYVKLINGNINSLEGEILKQENSSFTVPVDSIRNQGNGIYKILINELEYNGNFDFNKDLLYDTIRLRPIAVLDNLSVLKSNPYCKVGQSLEFQDVVNTLPIDFNKGELYENDNNYFLDIDNHIHTFPKNPTFFPTGDIVDKNIGLFIDGTSIKSYFGEEVQYGYITEIELIDKGFGYSVPPYVLIDYEPDRANAILVGNVIDRIELDRSLLRNYQGNVPTIEITTGRHALVDPIITDGRITSLVIEEEGEYYSEPPDIVIQDLGGKGREARYKAIISSKGRLVGVEKISEGLLYSDSTEVFVIPIANKTQARARVKLNSFNRVSKLNTPVDLLERYDDNFSNKMLELKGTERVHSPILGMAYDGNPIYGPYGYDNPFEVSDIRLMKSGWKLKDQLDIIRPVGNRGEFIEDYRYDYDWSHLDICNGRFCITPEYPNGIYAYFLPLTYDENSNDQLYHKIVFPYVIGQRFYSRPSIQLSNIKLSQINGIKRVRDSYQLDNFSARISQISSGSIEGIDIGLSGNNFKLNDKIVFENNRNLNAIVSEIRKGGIDKIVFDYGVLINIEDNVYIDASPIYSEYFSSDRSSIEVLFDTNNGNNLLGRITGDIEDKIFTRSSANTSVFVELTTNKNSFFTSGSILNFYDERGNKSIHSVVYEVVSSISNSNKVIIKFNVLEEDKDNYIDSHDKYLQDSFNYGEFIKSIQERILIRSDIPDDTQDSFITSYKDLSYQFKAISVGDSFGVTEFNESHGIGLGQEIQFGGSIIGRKKFIVYLDTNGKISFKDNQGIVVEGEDIYFYKGIDYLLELEENVNIGYLDFTYQEDVSIPIYLSEIIRINDRQIIVRFDKNTQYSYLYFFDRDNIQKTFRNKILVIDSPLSGNIIVENSTNNTLAFLLNKEITHFPSDGNNIEDLEDVRNIKKIINELDSSSSNTFLSFYFSYITIGNPTPTQIGQINNIRILGGNNELFNLPSIIGVENQIIRYEPQYVNGELSSFGSIEHEKPFKNPLAILYIGNRYIGSDNFNIIERDGYVTNVLLEDPITVNGEIDLKIVESDVELYPYSNSIGNVIEVDNTYEYDIPNNINRLPIIKTSSVYVLEGKNNFNIGDSITLKDNDFNQSFVIDKQGNNIVTISNSNFSVGDIIVNQNRSEFTVKAVIWNEFSPGITNHIDIIEANRGLGWGHIGENTQRIQDGKFYQDHSYVVRTQNEISQWRNYVKDTIHPAGFELFGELYQKYNNTVEVNSIEAEVVYNFNYDITMDVEVVKEIDFKVNFNIFNEIDTTIERGQGSISTTGGIDDIGMILVELGNEVNNSGQYEILGENNRILKYTPLDVLIYTINGIFVDVLQFDDEITYPQTVDLSENWKEENDFYGLGFLKDDNPRYNQKLKNIFQRTGRWLDAANLIELNIDNLLNWITTNTTITSRNYYNRKTILKFRIFIESVIFGVRFGGNNKVFTFVRDNPEIDRIDLNSIIELIVFIVRRNKNKLKKKKFQFIDLEHIPEDNDRPKCDDVVQYLKGLVDCEECTDPDFINNETTEFDLFWDDGSEVILSEHEDLFIIVDGVLQVPNESYVIDKTGETSKIIFSRPLKWQQTRSDRLANLGLNINTFMGYNLNPYYVLELERYGDDQWVLVDVLTKVKRQINYPLAVLVFIDGVLQKYGTVYTIEDSIVTFIDNSILTNRKIHIRYLYDKDINIDHYIHDYWSDKYFAKATIFIPYIDSVGDLFDFVKLNENKLMYLFQGDLNLGRIVSTEYSEEALGLYVKILASSNINIKQDEDFEFKLYNPGSLKLNPN